MEYRRQQLAGEPTPEALAQHIDNELERVEQALQSFDVPQVVERHAAPSKLSAGMMVLADGTDWNPGAGAGFYGYYGGAWHKLG